MTLNINIKFYENVFCEHCGKLEAFDPVYIEDDSGTSWCLYCALANGDLDEEEVEEAAMAAVDQKMDYFAKRVAKYKKEHEEVEDW